MQLWHQSVPYVKEVRAQEVGHDPLDSGKFGCARAIERVPKVEDVVHLSRTYAKRDFVRRLGVCNAIAEAPQ